MTALPAARSGPADLTPAQVKTLLAQINPTRVQTLNGQSHVEAWDIRRWLNRVFGFGGWSDETLELACVAQTEIKPGRWTVVYRAQVRLTICTPDGRHLSSWDDAAAGAAQNQPRLGDAHDMAMKTALSQALKRCATNLGDQFGLSLYNDGSRRAVIMWSAVHTPAKDPETAAAQDEPVKPETAPEPAAPVPTPSTAASGTTAVAATDRATASPAPDNAAEQRLRRAAAAAGLGALDAEFERVHGMPIGQAPVAVLDRFRQQIEAAGGAR
ncbi:Rad52/Rad22 family DNA repair protein [Streptomyces sp. ML-6]|uniref:Rad52/Rad22 family DNA repair protein n=1 Tax=Streptomyces sp. ML-6 TaxID=2982693 RepID=UPI0024BFAB17|nr:Rad52/Rad22 family DNA repair protein [Streptomyces sp. ML-6]MDK0520351.1 Rad52/Rad22 family DNA repair protein [Streptomyces sp. ML-6]